MKKLRSDDIMTSDISFKKVSGGRVPRSHGGKAAVFHALYIIYISNGNNVMMSLAFICRPFAHDIILTLWFPRRFCHPFTLEGCHAMSCL